MHGEVSADHARALPKQSLEFGRGPQPPNGSPIAPRGHGTRGAGRVRRKGACGPLRGAH